MAITWREVGVLSDAAGLDDYEEEECETADRDKDDSDECLFGVHCLMPGLHPRSECHTVEMAQAWAEEAARNS